MGPENVCVPIVLPLSSSFDLMLLPVPVAVEIVIGKPKLKPLPVNNGRNTVLPVPVLRLLIVSDPLVPTTLLLSNSITTLAKLFVVLRCPMPPAPSTTIGFFIGVVRVALVANKPPFKYSVPIVAWV